MKVTCSAEACGNKKSILTLTRPVRNLSPEFIFLIPREPRHWLDLDPLGGTEIFVVNVAAKRRGTSWCLSC